MLDNGALSRDRKAFDRLHTKMEASMDMIVNGSSIQYKSPYAHSTDYHQAFHSAIQKFSSVVENINESQKKVHKMKDSLEDTKVWLSNKSYHLLHLWLKNAQLTEMVRILDQVYVSFSRILLEY